MSNFETPEEKISDKYDFYYFLTSCILWIVKKYVIFSCSQCLEQIYNENDGRAPALSWDENCSMTKVKLDLISDVDIHLFFSKGMRDDVSYISKRYRKAKNKYFLFWS